MMIRLAVALSVVLASLFSLPPAFAQARSILPIGDSITQGVAGQCSYRKPLTESLASRGCEVAFRGPEQSTSAFVRTDCVLPEPFERHAGYAGRRTDEFGSDLIARYMSDYAPDYVLLHLGSNDMFQNKEVNVAIAGLDRIITETLTLRPTAQVLLANVIPSTNAAARIDELTAAVNVLAAQRAAQGDAVTLVDVASGFDPAEGAMTVDGIHPNSVGDALMASRFLTKLEELGACGPATPSIPDLTLADNQWYQITLPADPGQHNSVVDIFDELPMGRYAADWVVYGADPDSSNGFRYRELKLGDEMAVGEAYWVIQRADTEGVTIRMPSGSTPVQPVAETGCAGNACFSVPLQASSGTTLWNLVGFPLLADSSIEKLRVRTASGGCASGCDLDEAGSNDVIASTMVTYTTDNEYRQITTAENRTLNAWEGLWVRANAGAYNSDVQLLLAP